MCHCVQDLCTREEWLDLLLGEHAGLRRLVLQQLDTYNVELSPAGTHNIAASFLTLRALLWQYQHPRKTQDLTGLNTFVVPPVAINSTNKPAARLAALMSSLATDFVAAAWPCPDTDVLRRMAERLVSLDQQKRLPAGQELRPVFTDSRNVALNAPTGSPGSGTSPAASAAGRAMHAHQAASPPQAQRVDRVRSLAGSPGGSGQVTTYVDKQGNNVSMMLPASHDGQYTAEQSRGWCEAMMEAHETGDLARSQELSRAGAAAFKLASCHSAPAAAEASATSVSQAASAECGASA